MKFESRWNFRDRVYLDNDNSIVGFITAFQFREERPPMIEVAWVHNGDSRAAWFEEWRLERVKQ
jgi:hypothetical protein